MDSCRLPAGNSVKPTKITGPSGLQTFGYDTCANGKGRLCATTAPHADAQFSYARDGQVATRREIMTVGGVATNYPITYAYDVAGRLTAIVYSNGMKFGYGETLDRPVSMTVTQGSVTGNIVLGATYKPFGPVSAWTYGNGMTRRVSYDADGLPIGISSNKGCRWSSPPSPPEIAQDSGLSFAA